MPSDLPDGMLDGVTRLHSERLWPSPVVWVVGELFAASFGLVGLRYSDAAALAGLVAAVAVVTVGLVAWSGRVEVGPQGLRAGPALLPPAAVGDVVVLDAAAMRRARGVDLDARAYLFLRGWLAEGVRVEVDDDADDTPHWLVSSRRPQHLAAALGALRRDG